MKRFSFLLLSILCLLLSSCALLDEMQGPQLTPLEIQTLQTREYSASKELVFASAISMFQDLGYNIVSADQPTGFISAKSLLQSGSQTTATAFIEQMGNKTQIRLSFMRTKHGSYLDYDGFGENKHYYEKKYKRESQILDAAPYQNAFERIESGLFVRSTR